MPVRWHDSTKGAPVHAGAFSFAHQDDPALRLTLWPHRSLPRQGFVAFIGITFLLFLLPLFAVIGTVVLWGLLPFVLLVLGLTWYALQRNYRDGDLTEDMYLWTDKVVLTRTEPNRDSREWTANPHWIQVEMSESQGPVDNYITLKGGDRIVELGAFLSPDERKKLCEDLRAALDRLKSGNHPDYQP